MKIEFRIVFLDIMSRLITYSLIYQHLNELIIYGRFGYEPHFK